MLHHITLLKTLPLALILIFSFSRCSNDPAGADNEYRRYVVDMIDSIRDDAFYADRVDWDSVEDAFQPMLDTLTSTAGAHELLQQIVWSMEDRNSGFYAGDESYEGNISPGSLPVEMKLYDDNISYLLVPAYYGPESGLNVYMEELCRAIDSMRGHSINGVILDLRWNSGASLYATIVGLRPFLPEGTVGYFTDRRSTQTPVLFKEDALYYGEEKALTIPEGCSNEGADQRFDDVPIVVLVGKSTIGGGEMIVASLKGRDNVYLIGETTSGWFTWATAKYLPDGSAVWYSAGTYADSKGAPVTAAIVPDELSVMETDELVRRATEHLKSL